MLAVPKHWQQALPQQMFCLLQPTQVLSRFSSSSSLTCLTPEVSGFKTTRLQFLPD